MTPSGLNMIQIFKHIHIFLNRQKLFLVSFLVIFTLSFSVLNTVGFVPEPVDTAERTALNQVVSAKSNPGVTLTQSDDKWVGEDVVPARIVVESVGIDVAVNNPQSRDISVLDESLLSGAVRYPGSGFLDEKSNMFIFGHSSFLPTVNNGNFRAFNNLEKVRTGDLIRVESTDMVNIYRVERVALTSADEALVALSNTEKKLTLSTCNSFGNPGDRYIVEASFVESRAL